MDVKEFTIPVGVSYMNLSIEALEQRLDNVGLFPAAQTDRRKEAIRQALMTDVFKIKLFGGCIVAFAALIYLLTDSAVAYIVAGLLGVAALHYMAFVWARPFLQLGTAQREERRARRERQVLQLALSRT